MITQNTKHKIQNTKLYDVIIIGAGPAGLSAALYAYRYKLSTLVLGKDLGGALLNISEVENFPGQKKLEGRELADLFLKRVKNKVRIRREGVLDVLKVKGEFLIKAEENTYKAKKIIITTGVSRKRIGVPGEKEFERRGVGYCAVCDAPIFKNKKVAVVGGGNAALHAAILLAQYAKEVTLLVRNELSADPILIDHIEKDKKIKLVKKITIKEIKGSNFVESITLSRKVKNKNILKVDGVFIEAGIKPVTDFLNHLKIKKDREGFLKVNSSMEASVKGLYAAGDISTGSDELRQVVTASAEGAVSVTSIYNQLKER